jgi:hypothetical protein
LRLYWVIYFNNLNLPLLLNHVDFFACVFTFIGASDIPVNSVSEPQVDSILDAIPFVVNSSEFVQALLKKNKAALSRLFAPILISKGRPEKDVGAAG